MTTEEFFAALERREGTTPQEFWRVQGIVVLMLRSTVDKYPRVMAAYQKGCFTEEEFSAQTQAYLMACDLLPHFDSLFSADGDYLGDATKWPQADPTNGTSGPATRE